MGGQQAHPVDLPSGPLGVGVEHAQGLDFVIEEVDAVWRRGAHWVEIDDRTAHGELAVFINVVDRAVPRRLKQPAHLTGGQVLTQIQHEAAALQVGPRCQPLHGGRDW